MLSRPLKTSLRPASRMFFVALLVWLVGCQTSNLEFVSQRATQLKPLNSWHPTWCQVEARLTQPALARYREMLGEVDADTLTYTWKARKTSCEMLPLQKSKLVESHKAFMDTAMCLLLQVHFVNSPFADLPFKPEDIVKKDGDIIQIRASAKDPALGIYLDPKEVKVETRTKSRGTFIAVYALSENEYLPARIEQVLPSPASHVVLDQFEYETSRLNGRRMIKSFWISAGEEAVHPHTQVFLSSCQNF